MGGGGGGGGGCENNVQCGKEDTSEGGENNVERRTQVGGGELVSTPTCTD